jgi:extradiol dioxygenase family protein
MAAFLAAIPVAALAHGAAPAAQHGGIVAEASDEHWVELVLKGTQMTVYVSDEANKPVASARLGGKATVLVGGKSQQVVLVPAEADSLAGNLDAAVTGKVTSVVTLTIDGKSAQVRFATTQP